MPHLPNRFEKHLFLGDFHIPDHNQKILPVLLKFIKDLKPDYIYLLGDVLNLTHASKYPPISKVPTPGEEIIQARKVIFEIAGIARKENKKVKIYWLEGNHSERLTKYIYRNASALTDITDEYGDLIITIPNIFKLKEHGITWIPSNVTKRVGEIDVEHGDISRCKAGYTAQAMIDKRGRCVIMGHSHKVALIARNQDGDIKFGWEIGCLANLQPTPNWTYKPDWSNGLGVGIYDRKEKILHPISILFQKNQFYFEGKVYK